MTRFSATQVTSLGEAALEDCSSLTEAVIGPITELKDSTFNLCSSLSKVTLMSPGLLTTIGKYAFNNTLSLKTVGGSGIEGSVNLPGLKGIYPLAFCYSGITSIDVPELLVINDGAFENTLLTTVNAPKLEYCYGTYCFGQNNSLESIYLPAIKQLGDFTFGYCHNLKTIRLGPNLKTISRFIFTNITSNLERTLIFEGQTPPTAFSSDAFYVDYTNRSKLFGIDYGSISVIVPQGKLEAYKTAFRSANTAYEAYCNVMTEAN